MDARLQELFADFSGNLGASKEELASGRVLFGGHMPKDYEEFLVELNGGEGFVRSEYVMLWRIDELRQFNAEYETAAYAPGLLLFGSNGGGEGYAFDLRSEAQRIVSVPLIGLSLKDIVVVSDSFSGFLLALGSKHE